MYLRRKIDAYLMKKPGVTKNTENWNWIRYMIGDKMFEFEQVCNENISYYSGYEDSFDTDLKQYQSRIYPLKETQYLRWYHIKTDDKYIGAICLLVYQKNSDLKIRDRTKTVTRITLKVDLLIWLSGMKKDNIEGCLWDYLMV